MNLCLEGMDYFYRYDEFQLKSCITLAYVGWAGILVVLLLQDRVLTPKKKRGRKLRAIDQITFVLSVLIFIILTGKMDSLLIPTPRGRVDMLQKAKILL